MMRRILICIAGKVCSAAVLCFFGASLLAQSNSPTGNAAATSAALPSYEVTSVKVDPNGDINKPVTWNNPQNGLGIQNMTLELMIRLAYFVKSYQVVGGPNWLDKKEYEVEAKLDDAEAAKLAAMNNDEWEAERRLLLQSLLADRFKLAVHHETREAQGLALVVAKDGPKFQEASPDTADLPKYKKLIMEGGILTFNSGQMGTLATLLSQVMNQTVIDRTKLTGNYKFTIPWKMEEFQLSAIPVDGADLDASIATILQDQLGLKLVSIKVPIDFIVIDHVEEPTPN